MDWIYYEKNNILWIRKINAFQMCFSDSTNTETEKPLNFNSFSKLLNFEFLQL